MKFSILLPTRDRLALLKLAVASVLRQDHADFEIIISDNNSADAVEEYVNGLGDARIRYCGFSHPVPVTENWNNAIAQASGDYILMLGDDDALCNGCLARLCAAITAHDYPDCVYSGAYMFTYRGVLPGVDTGSVHENRNAIFWRDSHVPYWLARSRRLQLVNDAMRMYNSYGFNMQFITISRRMVASLSEKSDFFRTQYPDYYAMNNLLLNAERFLVVEQPLVAIGTSKSSFGWYYHNKKEDSGNRALNIEADMSQAAREIREHVLPGTSMNTNWLTSMMCVHSANPDVPGLVSPDIARYRRSQIIYCVLMIAHGSFTASDRKQLQSRLGVTESLLYISLLPLAKVGPAGRRLLELLHVVSQKRAEYLLRAAWKRLRGRSPVIRFAQDHTILEAEQLIGKVL